MTYREICYVIFCRGDFWATSLPSGNNIILLSAQFVEARQKKLKNVKWKKMEGIRRKNKDWNVYARKHSLSGAQETFVTSFNGGSCCQQQYHRHHYHHPIFLVASMHLTSIHLSISTSSLYSHSFSCRLRTCKQLGWAVRGLTIK